MTLSGLKTWVEISCVVLTDCDSVRFNAVQYYELQLLTHREVY